MPENTPGMDIGQAMEKLKNGAKVAREGWNGKNMFIYYVPSASYAAQTEVAQKEFGHSVPYRHYIAMKTAQGDVAPWSGASNTDLLAMDWKVVE